MASPFAVANDSVTIPRQKVERDLKVSLVILGIGVGLTGVWLGVLATGVRFQTELNPTSTFLIQLLVGVGKTMLFVGAIFAAINWSMLRRKPQTIRARPS